MIFAPSPTTSPLPTFNPTPTPVPITDKPTKSNAPSKTPTKSPTLSPARDDRAKIIRSETTNVITAVTCEESFHIQNLLKEYNFSDPPLTDIVVEFNYDIFVNNVSDRTAALEELDSKMFLSVVNSSPWMKDGVPTSSCDEMLMGILNMDELQQLGGNGRVRGLQNSDDWSNFLGWKNEPMDEYKNDAECVTSRVVDGYTCYPVIGRITAQVPVDLNLAPLATQLQIMSHVKASVERDEFLSGTIGAVDFLGQTTNDGKSEFDRDKVPTSPPEPLENNKLLSAFGISAICAISATVLCVIAIFGLKHQRRRKERQFEKLQNDAVGSQADNRLDAAAQTPEKVEQPRHVFTENSPDGVEIVDMNTCGDNFCGFGEDASTHAAETSGVKSGKKGFSIGSFMDGLRGGKDDLSYASGPSKGGEERSIAEDSAFSVETEDYGNSVGPSSFSRPNFSSISNNRRFASEL